MSVVSATTDDLAFACWTQGGRERQEDTYRLLSPDPGDKTGSQLLLLVADGMGGQAAGDVASHAAATAFVSTVKNARDLKLPECLRDALADANAAIGRRVEADAKLKGMGTTLVAAVVEQNAAHWISVGDSLLLLLRGGKLSRLNEDHSLAGLHAEMAARGEISKAEAEQRGGHHQLRSALMGDPPALIDQRGIEKGETLRPGDVLIVASDGLLTLGFDNIRSIAAASRKSAKAIAEGLVEAVNAARVENQDNATVIAYVHPGKPRVSWGFSGLSSVAVITLLALGAALAILFAVNTFLQNLGDEQAKPATSAPIEGSSRAYSPVTTSAAAAVRHDDLGAA